MSGSLSRPWKGRGFPGPRAGCGRVSIFVLAAGLVLTLAALYPGRAAGAGTQAPHTSLSLGLQVGDVYAALTVTPARPGATVLIGCLADD